jgi:predicted RNA-binding protein YlxR (DUF448 family)
VTRGGRHSDAEGSERRCIARMESLPKDRMIRFVISPDGIVTPDIAERLPGRGIWVAAEKKALTKAIARNLFARAAKAPAKVPAGLLDLIESLLVSHLISLISLARKGGSAVAGFDKVKSSLLSEQALALIQASDGSEGQKRKLRPPEGENTYISCLKGDELGLAFGREHVIHAALLRGGLSKRVLTEANRLAGIRGKTAATKAKQAG